MRKADQLVARRKRKIAKTPPALPLDPVQAEFLPAGLQITSAGKKYYFRESEVRFLADR
jgi:hypothetical protein